MKRRSVAVLLTALVAALVAPAPAGAITKHSVKDFEHPFVGLVAFYDDGGDFVWRCSGSLIDDGSPADGSTLFLTAGHCTDGVDNARVYFQQDAGANYDPATQQDPLSGYPDTCAPGTLGVTCATSDELYDYGFDDFAGFPNTHDAGVVILDQPITLAEYGQLPAPGTLDGLASARGAKDLTFTVSGYGLSYRSPVQTVSFRERLMASSTLVNLTSFNNAGFNLQTNGNGDGRGGTCSGDSGGPVFYPANSNTVMAVTSFGMNSWCRGTDFAYRIDQPAVLSWIADPVDQG